ncbi:Transcription factor, fungi [Penicillium expansum]|uniref:Transcription factor, fungi n=1 Tax=Penicillium expansum TaxID=27334 RepID=A0A0A2JAV9_PENEN|nr:Transcription factor, fungi [Penicillium expansum]KGO43780.1 Transcription factor, fungi [Penicillium expansum]KGO44633.1 Transcription factor, fungi [Penicillium expansum]KGO51946.1 Transcription factor, fungi [Penicillium expansum]
MATPRRNGQLSSCEPCRKSKLRCDHQSPICGRCLHGEAERCFYHPAPLTQPRERASRVISRKPTRRQCPENQSVFRLDQRISSTATQGPPSVSPPVTDEGNTLCDQHIARWAAKEKRNLAPGLMGLVSPKDIFSEYEDTLRVEEAASLPAATVPATTYPLSDSSQVLLGAQILSHLQKISWFHEIIELKNKLSPGWFLGPPLTRALFNSMEQMYDCAVRNSQDTHASLATLSRQICVNTSKDIRTHPKMNVSEYFNSIAPRWETIGLVFALLGRALFRTPDDDPIFTHRNPWKLEKGQLRNIATAIGDICCQFCNSAGTTSDPFCWLIIQQLVLLNSTFGDSDYRVWQKLGDLSTIIYEFGLHQSGEDIEENFPFFLVEIRKRTMVCAYAIDKQLATSLGRPPRICSRYCTIPLPLDISCEKLVLTRSEREKAMQNLDENGWNTEGYLTIGVKLRVVLLVSLMRESILELSLSPTTEHIPAKVEFVSHYRIHVMLITWTDHKEPYRKLIQESRQMQQDLPSFLQWSPEEAAAGAYNSTRDEGRAFVHIEFTYQEFLLHRILQKRLGRNSQGLIESSLEIVTTLSDIIGMRTRYDHLVDDMSWDVRLFWPQYYNGTFLTSSPSSSYATSVSLLQAS